MKNRLRLFRFVPRVLLAAAWGALRRIARRMSGKPPRIWHGTNGLHLIRPLVDVDRAAGFPSRSVVQQVSRSSYALFTAEEFDVVLEERGVPPDERHWAGLVDLLLRGDIWVAFFDSNFFPASQRTANRLALRLIRAAGIRIVMAPHGMDVLWLDERTTRYHWAERAQLDYPDWNLRAQKEVTLWRTNLFCEMSDFVISSDSSIDRYLPRRDEKFKWLVADTDRLRPRDDRAPNARPVIVHAPNHRHLKGTAELIAALDRVRAAGIDFELRLIEKVARAEALAMYADSDVVADQFCIGSFGMFALEGLALGRTVLAYLDQEQLGDPVFNLPIVNTTHENLAGVLAAVLALPELRARLGRAGRDAVVKYQSVAAMSEVWGRIYRHVWRGTPLDLGATAHFSSERTARSFSEDPADAAFWPVPVDDFGDAIHSVLGRIAP